MEGGLLEIGFHVTEYLVHGAAGFVGEQFAQVLASVFLGLALAMAVDPFRVAAVGGL